MSYQALAFFTGLFGSLHCIAMCGPLMMVMPFQQHTMASLLLQRVLYQVGRIFVYVLLGALAGIAGLQFQSLGFQNGVSIISGIILILAAIAHFMPIKSFVKMRFKFSLPNVLITLLGKFLTKPYGSVFAGAINGLLPCGMVYMAIAGSLSMPSVSESMIFMLFFGLGTTPLMLLAAIAPLFFKRRLRLSAVTPYLFLLVGFWLCLRGSSLDFGIFHQIYPAAGTTECK
jgi:uncharacterized protein